VTGTFTIDSIIEAIKETIPLALMKQGFFHEAHQLFWTKSFSGYMRASYPSST